MESTAAIDRFESLVGCDDEQIDLAECALTAAAVMNPEVDVDEGLALLDAMADEVRKAVAEAEPPLGQVNALSRYLFDELGFAGNVEDYYDPRNSLFDHVLNRRLGIPITLSLVYIEVGRRVGVPLAGIGMPGHFLVKHLDEDSLYIDPYHRGVILSEAECVDIFERISQGMRWDPSFLEPVSKRLLLARMLRNLGAICMQRVDLVMAERVLTLLVTLQPDEPGHRRDRGMLRFRLGQRERALEDLEAYADPNMSPPDAWYVRRLVERIKGGEA